jgi:hypothetical protein
MSRQVGTSVWWQLLELPPTNVVSVTGSTLKEAVDAALGGKADWKGYQVRRERPSP